MFSIPLKSAFITYFNTKFVIAKCKGKDVIIATDPFQYKICYSKIEKFTKQIISLNRFQYKICYSKIGYCFKLNTIFAYFNTKFVIAK